MAFLVPSDYRKQIQALNLSQISGENTGNITACELTAIEEMKSYLSQKYDISDAFADVKVWSRSLVYNGMSRVYLDADPFTGQSYSLNDLSLYQGNVYSANGSITPGAFNASEWTLLGRQYDLFFAKLPVGRFEYRTKYYPGDQVFYKNKVYTSVYESVYQDENIQYSDSFRTPYPNIFPDERAIGSRYWGNGTTYTVASGTSILNTTYWEKGDNRSQQLVTYAVDIVLYHVHKRIAPQNIPDLRVKAYDDACLWLKSCAKGSVSPNLPLLQPTTGLMFRWGSHVKQNNTY